MTDNYLRKICESGELNLARRWDRISLQVFGGSFVLVNGALIALARRRVNVLWAMLRDGLLYQEQAPRAA
jgi:hypothetical protein